MTDPEAPPLPADPRHGRQSRTRFVVLGLLTQAPGSVYSLRQRIAASVGHFWQESFGQLFPTLARLETEGLVVGTDVRDGRRRRRDFAITPAGRAALAAWLAVPPASQPERNELLLKVFFASEGDSRALAAFVVAATAEARQQLDEMRGIESFLRSSFGSDPRLPFWLLTVRYGILGGEALLGWCEEATAVLATVRRDESG